MCYDLWPRTIVIHSLFIFYINQVKTLLKTYQNYIAWLHLDSQSHKPWSKITHTETESQKRHLTQTKDPCEKSEFSKISKISWRNFLGIKILELICKMYILVSLKQQYHLWNRKIESSPQCLRLSGVYTYTLYTVYQFNKKSMSTEKGNFKPQRCNLCHWWQPKLFN